MKLLLEVMEQVAGPDHVDIAQCLENLAELYRETDRGNEAGALEQQASEIRAKQEKK